MQLIDHSSAEPFLYIGRGMSDFRGDKGNFTIEHYVTERVRLTHYRLDLRRPRSDMTRDRRQLAQTRDVTQQSEEAKEGNNEVVLTMSSGADVKV